MRNVGGICFPDVTSVSADHVARANSRIFQSSSTSSNGSAVVPTEASFTMGATVLLGPASDSLRTCVPPFARKRCRTCSSSRISACGAQGSMWHRRMAGRRWRRNPGYVSVSRAAQERGASLISQRVNDRTLSIRVSTAPWILLETAGRSEGRSEINLRTWSAAKTGRLARSKPPCGR
jgi:hypothetical protein